LEQRKKSWGGRRWDFRSHVRKQFGGTSTTTAREKRRDPIDTTNLKRKKTGPRGETKPRAGKSRHDADPRIAYGVSFTSTAKADRGGSIWSKETWEKGGPSHRQKDERQRDWGVL